MMRCPYPGCAGEPVALATSCPSCAGLLIWCRCGMPNRLLARFCHDCGERLACEGEWRLAHGDAGSSSHLSTAVPYMPAIREDRRFQLAGALAGQFLYGHHHLFFPLTDRGVAVYRAHDCEPVVRISARSRNIHAIALTDEFLLVAGDGGVEAAPLLPLLTQAGGGPVRLLKRPEANLSRAPLALLPLVDPPLLCVATSAALYGIAPADGTAVWQAERLGQGAVQVARTPAGLVAVEESGELSVIDPATGVRRTGRKLPERVKVRAGCTASGNQVFVIGASGALLIIFAEKGTWLDSTLRFSQAGGLACEAGQVYVTGVQGLQRCDPLTARTTTLVPDQILLSGPLVTVGTAFAGADSGALVCASTDPTLQRYQLRNGVQARPLVTPVLAGTHLYFASDQGEVVRYEVATGGEAG